jgi:hypothetical protein
VPLPARHHVAPWRRQYACLAHRPAWLVETARGCPFRCSFCSIWQLHARAVRERSIDSVCRDFASVGNHVFVADDLFWHHPSRSLELRASCGGATFSKHWILVQRPHRPGRTPSGAARGVAADREGLRHLLRPRGGGPTKGLDGLMKDASVDETARGVEVARRVQVRVTGNFVIDPAWTEPDFEHLWAVHRTAQAVSSGLHDSDAAARHERTSRRCGRRCAARRWSHFDMHHCCGSRLSVRAGSSSSIARPGGVRC